MIVRKVDIKNLEEQRDELETTIESDQKEFRNLIDLINRKNWEIEEIESELGVIKNNVEEMKKTASEFVEFNKLGKEKLNSVINRLNVINRKEQEYTKPSDKIRPDTELSICDFP